MTQPHALQNYFDSGILHWLNGILKAQGVNGMLLEIIWLLAFYIAILIFKKLKKKTILFHVWHFLDCLNRWVLQASGTL